MNPHDRIAKMIERGKEFGVGGPREGEILDYEAKRVLALPTRGTNDAAAAARWTAALALHDDAPPLRPAQGAALDAIFNSNGTPRGAFGAIGIGHGKTLITLLAATVAGAARPVLMFPPAMRAQFDRDVQYWKQHYAITVPELLPYSMLSMPAGAAELDRIAPDFIILDEAHSLRDQGSARTRRVQRYLEHHPRTRVVALSGTITGSSVTDHAHILRWALRERTPLPIDHRTLASWAAAMDPSGDPDHAALATVWPLVLASGGPAFRYLSPRQRRSTVRAAYRERLSTLEGVVSTADASVAIPLILKAVNPGPTPQAVVDALTRLEELGAPPVDAAAEPDAEGEIPEDGVADAMHLARIARTLSVGFYYRWAWGPVGSRTEPDFEWLDAKRAWDRTVRQLASGRPGWDSPASVERQVRVGLGSKDARAALAAWDAVRSRPAPTPEAVWLPGGDWAVRDAARRAQEANDAGAPLVIWYRSRAVGEALAALGVPVYGRGTDSPIFDGRSAAASIAVHGVGKNLQAWSHALVIEPPAGGGAWEQMLGRLHRLGQAAPRVVVEVYQHLEPLVKALEAAKTKALYISETLGVPQRLLTAQGDFSAANAETETFLDFLSSHSCDGK